LPPSYDSLKHDRIYGDIHGDSIEIQIPEIDKNLPQYDSFIQTQKSNSRLNSLDETSENEIPSNENETNVNTEMQMA